MTNWNKKNVVILGAGGHARENLWLFKEANLNIPEWEVLGFVDENPELHQTTLCDLPVLGGFEWFDDFKSENLYVICAVGNTLSRKKMVRKAKNKKLKFCTIIHPSVKMSSYVDIGEGTTITAGNIITTQIEIGEHVILNLNCTVCHDTIIADYCTIAPGAHISGNVNLDEGVDIGTGAILIQGTRVGEWSVIGAGSVVNRDIPAHVTAVGVPAKVIKEHKTEETK